MKPRFEEFVCPQCGHIRYIYIDGVCASCRTENELERIIHERKNALMPMV
jgi:uncharacterized OB-fold protein